MKPGWALALPWGPSGTNNTCVDWESAGGGSVPSSATYVQALHPQDRAMPPWLTGPMRGAGGIGAETDSPQAWAPS